MIIRYFMVWDDLILSKPIDLYFNLKLYDQNQRQIVSFFSPFKLNSYLLLVFLKFLNLNIQFLISFIFLIFYN
jgi:hypothetical protein